MRFKSTMDVIKTAPALIRKPFFTGITKPVKPFVAPKSNCTNLNNAPLKNLNPAYFHPSFCANPLKLKDFDDLLNFALKNPEKITEETENKLLHIFNDEAKISRKNYINRGAIGKVYGFSNDFVFKKDSMYRKIALPFSRCRINPENINKDLDIYYGSEVANIGSAKILQNADPEKRATILGAPINKFIFDSTVIWYYKRKKFAQKLAAMPQEAFDKVAKNFDVLNKRGSSTDEHYAFDFYNPNNFLLLDKEIRIVDELDRTSERNVNNIGGMLAAFITQMSAHVNAKPSAELLPARREIMKKCFLATEKAQLPIDWDSYDRGGVSRVYSLIKIKRQPGELLAKLKEFRATIPDMTERLKAVEEYIDELK